MRSFGRPSLRQSIGSEIINDVHDDNGSAVLHTATILAGAMTFAEFFTFEGGLIASLNLQ